MPRIRTTRSAGPGKTKVTVRKDHEGRAVQGDILAYGSRPDALARADPDDHEIGKWTSPETADRAGSGLVADDDAYGRWLVVSETYDGSTTWSAPKRVPPKVGA